MTKFSIFWVLILICVIFSFAWADDISISTYYPAPYGVHRILRLYPEDIAALGSPCSLEGEMFYHATDKQVYLCSGTVWQTFAGYWALSDNNLYPASTAYNVGIGTTAPTVGYKLEVAGKLKAKNLYLYRLTGVSCPSNDCVRDISFPANQFTTTPIIVCSVQGGRPSTCTVQFPTKDGFRAAIGDDDPTTNPGNIIINVLAIEP